MGAAASTNVSTNATNIITNSLNSCGTTTAANTVNITGLTYTQPQGCPANAQGGLTINQASTVDATCLLNTMISNTAANAASLSATAQAGFGVAVSTNVSTNEQNITSSLNNTCGNVAATGTVSVSDSSINSCNGIVIAQNATPKSMCQISALQQAVAQSTTTQSAASAGASLSSILFGGIGVSIGSIVLLLCIAAGAYYYYKNYYNKEEPKEDDDGGDADGDADATGGSFGQNSYVLAIIMVILILAVVFVAFSTKPQQQTQLTPDDLTQFQNTVEEARQIAHLDSDSGYGPEYPNYHLYTRQTTGPFPANTFVQSYGSDPIYYDNLSMYYEPII
jgi:hypothetical protein